MSLITTWICAKHGERESNQKLLEDKLQHGWQTVTTISKKYLDLVWHYNLHHCSICHSAENTKIESFYNYITFSEEQYNQQEMSLYKLSFSNNLLYLAALLGKGVEAIIVLTTFHQEK